MTTRGGTVSGFGHTRARLAHVSCSCGHAFSAELYDTINAADDPELVERFVAGELHVPRCPECGARMRLEVPLRFHDPEAALFALVLPEGQRHAELKARIELLQQLAQEPVDLPLYVRQAEVLFGTAGLIARRETGGDPPGSADELRLRQAVLEQREAELDRREEDLAAREEDLVTRQEDLIGRIAALEREQEEVSSARDELARERTAVRALSLDVAARRSTAEPAESQPAPTQAAKPPAAPDSALLRAELAAWRASGAPTGRFVRAERVLITVRGGGDPRAWRDAAPTVILQRREVEGASLALIVIHPVGAEAAAWPAALCAFDLGAAADRALLERLGERFALEIEAYDEESRPLASWSVALPLEENVRQLLARPLDQPAPTEQLERAIAALSAMEQPELLGRKQHNFAVDSFVDLPSPSAARLALGILSYWSEPENEDYLLFTKSFPATHWRQIRERVVVRAIEFGLWPSARLVDFAVQCGLAAGPRELLSKALSNFAEVSLALKANDLDPLREWGNWKALLGDCVQHELRVEPQVESLAAAAARRAQEWATAIVDESEPGGDLGALNDQHLVRLLADRSQRRDAAVELCDRGAAGAAEAIYGAVRNMTRGEVVQVVPAMVQLGNAAVPHFVQGLRHHKSFIRQGCALALGTLKARGAAEALTELLLAEPTRIWLEVARALGDLGGGAIDRLCAVAAEADGEGRERLAWALGHVALDAEGRKRVERLAEDVQSVRSKVARRALAVVGQVRRTEAEVRGEASRREQTIVRAFSRRFYEAMREENQLTEADIVEQEEVPIGGDDEDAELEVVDEELEVVDEDIIEPAT